jgi:hypothetical protein
MCGEDRLASTSAASSDSQWTAVLRSLFCQQLRWATIASQRSGRQFWQRKYAIPYYENKQPGDIWGHCTRWFGRSGFYAVQVPGRGLLD